MAHAKTQRTPRHPLYGFFAPLRLCVMLFQVQQVIDHYTFCSHQIGRRSPAV